jgi:transposase
MSIATQEIRERALTAHEAGQTQIQVAQCYGIHIRTFQRWLKDWRATGRTAPLPRGHNPPALNEAEMQQLADLVEKRCDATLEELRGELNKQCSLTTIHNALERLGYDVKKNAPGQRTRSSRR